MKELYYENKKCFKDERKVSDKEKRFYRLLLQTLSTSDYVTTKIMADVSDMPESTTRRYLKCFIGSIFDLVWHTI